MIARVALAALLFAVAPARAQDLRDRWNIRLALSGMYLTEAQDAATPQTSEVSPFRLGYGELRVVIDGRRLARKIDVHLDGRVRLTGAWSRDAALAGQDQVTARGYLGGPEYDLREAWVRLRDGRIDLAIGRLMIPEADALRLDGARLTGALWSHWDGSLFVGAYFDPYSRSLTTDYTGSLAVAGGANISYSYERVWGSLAVVGSYLGGNDAGGRFDPASPAGTPHTETPRTFIAWRSFERLLPFLDLFHDAVIDVSGAAGAQLTRLDAMLTARLGSRLVLHLAYDYLSSLAIEMYLTRLLASRALFPAATIENNLTVQRTAHQSGRVEAEVTFGRLTFYGEGRLRYRSIVRPADDPQFVDAGGVQIAPALAYEATVGGRDRGSLAGFRLGASGTYLADFRGKTYLGVVEAGRSFAEERFGVDARFLAALTTDAGVVSGQAGIKCDTTSSATALATCFGSRSGGEYELGLTVTAAPFDHWFGFADYRLVLDSTDGKNLALTHLVMVRIEARY